MDQRKTKTHQGSFQILLLCFASEVPLSKGLLTSALPFCLYCLNSFLGMVLSLYAVLRRCLWVLLHPPSIYVLHSGFSFTQVSLKRPFLVTHCLAATALKPWRDNHKFLNLAFVFQTSTMWLALPSLAASLKRTPWITFLPAFV